MIMNGQLNVTFNIFYCPQLLLKKYKKKSLTYPCNHLRCYLDSTHESESTLFKLKTKLG